MTHDEASVLFFDGSGLREAAGHYFIRRRNAFERSTKHRPGQCFC